MLSVHFLSSGIAHMVTAEVVMLEFFALRL